MSEYYPDKGPIEFKRRATVAIVIAGAAFSLLAARLWYLQAKEGSFYTDLSQSNSIRLIKAVAPRGIIYDRNGVKVADNRPSYDLFIVPEDVLDWDMTRAMLKGMAGLGADEIDEKINKAKGRPPFQMIRLKEDLSWDEAVKIDSYKFEIPGLILDITPKRAYIYGLAFAHLIGHIGETNEKELKELKKKGAGYSLGDMIGKYGLEKAREKELRGADGGKEIEVDALGRKIKLIRGTPPYPGAEIRLTVDLRTQMAAYAAMKDRAGAAIAIEPSTGRILAMVSTPAFDPNALSTGISRDEWIKLVENPLDVLNNRAIQGLYPPASTFKPIHAAAALEEQVITPATEIFSGPSFRFANRDYRDWKDGGHGTIKVHKAIVQSSDTFFYQVGLKLGVDGISKHAKNFGFGAKTGVDLPNEKSGLVPSSAWKLKATGTRWYEGETISFAVGQGFMLTTPLQLANAYAAIANGGTLYLPQTIEDVRATDGSVLERFSPKALSRLKISAKNLDTVKEALTGVTHEEGGTALFLKASNLKIAGKTGTAQVTKLKERVKNIEKIAYKLRDHAWFAGYAPYDDPKITVVVIVEHGGFGASAAAPVANAIFKAYLGEAAPVAPGARQPLPTKPPVIQASAPQSGNQAEAYD